MPTIPYFLLFATACGALSAVAFFSTGRIEGVRLFRRNAPHPSTAFIQRLLVAINTGQVPPPVAPAPPLKTKRWWADLIISMVISGLAGWFLMEPTTSKDAFLAGLFGLVALQGAAKSI